MTEEKFHHQERLQMSSQTTQWQEAYSKPGTNRASCLQLYYKGYSQ